MGNDREADAARRDFKPAVLSGIWLTLGSVQRPIENLLLELLERTQPNPILRQSILEELDHPVKLLQVALEYLGMRAVGEDAGGRLPLILVSPHTERDPWRDALLQPAGDCPVGILIHTRDRGRVALVHEVFAHLSEAAQGLVKRYAALAAGGNRHAEIIAALSAGPDGPRRLAEGVADARRQAHLLDPSILFSPDGEIRVQLGSTAQTTRNLLREGLRGEQVFLLPQTLFAGKANYGDLEFLVYLNFFLGRGRPTRIVGTLPQQRALEGLLRLVIFGHFDPAAPEQPAFAELRAAFGVPDQDTAAFFRTAYEIYAVRQGPDPASPILGLDSYVSFIRLEGDETVIPIPRFADPSGATLGTVSIRPGADGRFAVRIVLPDGRNSAKQLAVAPPRRRPVAIPDELARPLRFATDRPRFGVTSLGTSHGFDPAGDLTSFILWLNGRGVLVDPSPEALAYLDQIGVAPSDVPYVFLTHVHADHDGGLLAKVLAGRRTAVIASDPVFRAFVKKVSLIAGHDLEAEGLVTHVPANPGKPIALEVAGETATLETRWNLHPIPTNGFRVALGGWTFGYSGDTQYDPALLERLRQQGQLSPAYCDALLHFFWTPDGRPTVDLLYHEAGGPPIHTLRDRLEALPDAIKARMFLVHIADKDVPADSLPGKPRPFGTHVLLPPTAASRHQILLETLRSVSYLYDVPDTTLEGLLREAVLQDHPPGGVIIRQGPVGNAAPLHFFVIADGDVAVKDGRRLITTLTKGDTFGEWGISHQRGYRVADVVATRPCRCLQLGEAQYWWLVERHPVVQDRISRLRSLLPRLQLAQARQRRRAQADAWTSPSVIAEMTPSQLAGFALFSEVRAFKHGQAVVLEGAEADGFYILLSGHLTVTGGGRRVGELSEGDVFGEIGLLEGGRRQATVTVASADAEILFMSRANFRALLQTVPAFAWGIRELAARRRRSDNPAGEGAAPGPRG